MQKFFITKWFILRMDKATRDALIDGLNHIDKYTDTLNLTESTKTKATKLFRELAQSDTDIFVGTGFETVAAACVVLAARQTTDLCDSDDLGKITSDTVKSQSILRAVNDVRDELDLGFVLADPHKYVTQLQDELSMGEGFTESVHDAVDVVIEDGVASGHKAAAVAACCVYAMSQYYNDNTERYTQKQISNTVDISTVTIRSHYRDYAKALANSPQSELTIKN